MENISKLVFPQQKGPLVTKADLIAQIAAKTSLSKADAQRSLDALVDIITTTLQQPGAKVALQGFGTFSAEDRAARTGRNVRTGATIQIAASRTPKFKASSVLKRAIQNG